MYGHFFLTTNWEKSDPFPSAYCRNYESRLGMTLASHPHTQWTMVKEHREFTKAEITYPSVNTGNTHTHTHSKE